MDEKPDATPPAEPWSPPPQTDLTEREMLLEAMGFKPEGGVAITANGQMLGRMSDVAEYRAWRDDLGLTWDEVIGVIAEVTASRNGAEPPTVFKYFTKPMQRFAALKARGPLQPSDTPPAPTGGRNARRDQHHRSDAAFRETLRRIESGEIKLGSGRRSPFGD
ncbi:hypothetical protein [Roseovarius sp. D0-M9]|uniref:hypothetical protein n=1 Tax=Roseovarius sp. D0-M9 TaxID=3127117 RepID=UPI00300FA98F